MAKRKRLADLVKEEVSLDNAGAGSAIELPPQGPGVTDSQTSVLPDYQDPRSPTPAADLAAGTYPTAPSTQSAPTATPKYLRLTRKEARLRDDQIEALSRLARRLNKERQGRGERITENTLIRVAVDLLLARQQGLHGTDEVELSSALLKPRAS